MRYVESEMASVRNIGLTNDEKKAENERDQVAMPSESSPNIHNKTPPRDSYWFAHGGVETISSKNAQNSSKSPGALDPNKEAQLQKEKEERIRIFREQQEEERLKKLKDLEQQFLLAKKHREQQEEERKRRIEEARVKEMERRQQVEERKRQIWEAEQERKEAILRRNMEREARIEARRNAQRNSQCFAFGSSTPRTFDLDLAAIGVGRNTTPGSVLMSSVSVRRSEERDIGPPRATSACSLDRKFETLSHDDFSNEQRDLARSMSLEPPTGRISNLSKQIALQHKSSNDMKACLSMWDNTLSSRPNSFDSLSPGWLVGSGVIVGEDCMSRSMVSLSSSAFRGRKRTDIMPTLTRERSITPHVTPRGNHCMRAVSMTRLDQLAQPRRPRTLYASPTTTNGDPRALSPSMTKSMCNLANTTSVGRRMHAPVSNSRRGNMSQSMMHLADTPQKDGRQLTPSPTLPKSNMRSAQSMMHLAAAPKLTRAARLRAQALAKSRAASAWNLSKPDPSLSGQYLSPGKDTSRSPSRPQSSMSGASEISATSSSVSAVNMRTRSAPRRPRPYSIAGSVVDRTPPAPPVTLVKKEPERTPRLQERNAQSNVTKPPRAKSVGREKSDDETPKPLTAPRKPVPPPKSKEVLARAKSHPVPTKDNLRKPVRPNVTNIAKANVEKQLENKEKRVIEKENSQDKVIKSPVESKSDNIFEIVNSSPVTSPVTDSEMCISSEDSRPITESDINTYTQTFTESESKAEISETAKIPTEKDEGIDNVVDSKENIPDKPEPKSVSVISKETEVKVTQETVQQNNNDAENTVVVPQKPRITSEEEARAALAEKRRLAREQAEREAEIERQRQEEIRRQEEEKRRIEEQKQREMEQEQIRLAELHRQLEAEKLRKAIEEQEQRQREEQERREEEARQKAEKEEQERKAREEAERQRIELEERLRKEEEERAERKRRVEQIMARTRGKSAAQTPPATTPSDTTNKLLKSEESNQSNSTAENTKTNHISSAHDLIKANRLSNGSVVSKLENGSLSTSVTNNCVSNISPFQSPLEEKKMSSSAHLPDLLNTNIIANHSVKSNGHHVDSSSEQFSSSNSVSNSFLVTSSRTLSANEVTSPTQTNGYSSHEDMSCTTSPEETSDAGLLIDIGSSQQNDARNNIQPADFTKLVEIEPSSLSNENYLINVDNVNSNLLSSEKPYSGFEECLQKSDAPVDLLS